jgi:hypothetical protein
MRLVKVKAPEGKGREVAQIAFDAGISQVTFKQDEILKRDGSSEKKDAVDVQTSTPKAKAFVDSVMAAPFFNAQDYSIDIRQPRSVVSSEKPQRLTWPLAEPTVDIFEELWQFSQVTLGFIGRFLIAAMLLAYGMIEYNLLLMIAGLLFMPMLPPLMAIGFGLWTRQFRLAAQGLFAFLVASALAVAGGAFVALMTDPPLRYNEFGGILTGLLISLAVGIAAGLATVDDVGRREMIGLAATAQIAIIPVWFGISLVFGLPVSDTGTPTQRLLSFLINTVTIIVTAFITYAFVRMRGDALRGFTKQ